MDDHGYYPVLPQPRLWIDVQLNVDSSKAELPDLAYSWIHSLAEGTAGPAMAELAGLPARPVKPTAAGRSGVLEVARSKDGGYPTTVKRNFSRKGSLWLRDELDDLPLKVKASISDLNNGGSALNSDLLLAKVRAPVHSPGWLLLDAQLYADRLTAPVVGEAEQQRWLELLFAFADRVNPGYGHISYVFEDDQTALEECTHAADMPRDEIEPAWTVGKSRTRLRGYSWLTIIAQELAEKLGGVLGLQRTGAFAEVRQLAEGGVWLLATEDFREYGMPNAEAVFHALAPVLRPGKPRPNLAPQQHPVFLVFEDPADR